MANQLTGRVEYLGTVQAVSTKSGVEFNRRELVLNCARYDQYTGEQVSENHPQFEFSGKACDKLNGLQVGDIVTVSFTLQGSWYERDGVQKNFTRVVGYDVEFKERKETKPAPAESVYEPAAIPPVPPMPVNGNLPF